MDAGKAHAAMADEVAAAKAANGEPVTAKPMATKSVTATETMAATSVTTASVTAATMASAAAGIGDLGQRHEPGDEHCKHQIEQLTTHDTLLLDGFSPVAIHVLG